ncbi:MAG: hypothetical protein R3F43_06995 [bacterium]
MPPPSTRPPTRPLTPRWWDSPFPGGCASTRTATSSWPRRSATTHAPRGLCTPRAIAWTQGRPGGAVLRLLTREGQPTDAVDGPQVARTRRWPAMGASWWCWDPGPRRGPLTALRLDLTQPEVVLPLSLTGRPHRDVARAPGMSGHVEADADESWVVLTTDDDRFGELPPAGEAPVGLALGSGRAAWFERQAGRTVLVVTEGIACGPRSAAPSTWPTGRASRWPAADLLDRAQRAGAGPRPRWPRSAAPGVVEATAPGWSWPVVRASLAVVRYTPGRHTSIWCPSSRRPARHLQRQRPPAGALRGLAPLGRGRCLRAVGAALCAPGDAVLSWPCWPFWVGCAADDDAYIPVEDGGPDRGLDAGPDAGPDAAICPPGQWRPDDVCVPLPPNVCDLADDFTTGCLDRDGDCFVTTCAAGLAELTDCDDTRADVFPAPRRSATRWTTTATAPWTRASGSARPASCAARASSSARSPRRAAWRAAPPRASPRRWRAPTRSATAPTTTATARWTRPAACRRSPRPSAAGPCSAARRWWWWRTARWCVAPWTAASPRSWPRRPSPTRPVTRRWWPGSSPTAPASPPTASRCAARAPAW